MAAAAGDRLSSEERKHAILEAALPIFAAKGFDAVTTREVAEAAGVSEALLYRHFSSKRAMYEEIQHVCVLRAHEDAQRLEALPDSSSTLVLSVYAIMRSIQIRSPADDAVANLPRLVLRSLLTDGEFGRAIYKAAESRFRPKIERCVRAAIAAGEIENDESAACLGAVLGHHLSCAMVQYRLPEVPCIDYPGSNDPEWLLDQSVRFVLRGLGMTRKAIETHYNPAAFAMLAAAR
jgi:AcrR family transcriptional regulator